MLNKKVIAVVSVICVLVIALPVFAHEGSGSGQRIGDKRGNCSVHGSGSSENSAGGARGQRYDVQGRIRGNSGQNRSDEGNIHAGESRGKGSGFSGNNGNSENRQGFRFSEQDLTGKKDGSGNGTGHANDRHEHKVNYQGQGPQDGSGRERQGSTGQGRKCGPRDGSGEGRGQGFKDGYHRNRK